MVCHVLGDIAQETGCQDGDHSKRNTNIIYPLVGFSICKLTRTDDHLICGLVPSNARNQLDFIQQRSTGKLNDPLNSLRIGDVEFRDHDTPNIMRCRRNKLGDEDVVVDRVANPTTNDTNRQGQRRNGGNKVLYISAISTSFHDKATAEDSHRDR